RIKRLILVLRLRLRFCGIVSCGHANVYCYSARSLRLSRWPVQGRRGRRHLLSFRALLLPLGYLPWAVRKSSADAGSQIIFGELSFWSGRGGNVLFAWDD